MKKKKGFTLIELLVVIAIIAVLLSILMPALGKVKGIARDVICRSNLKQWGMIWTLYTNDYQGKFPYAISGWPRGQWVLALRDEWPTEGKILLCPSAVKETAASMGGVNKSYLMGGTSPESASYGMNCWAYSKSDNMANTAAFKKNYWRTMNSARGSSNIPLFMDSKWRGLQPDYNGTAKPDKMEPTPAINTLTGATDGLGIVDMPRHANGIKGGINTLFFDLSATQVQMKQLWRLKWHRDFDKRGYVENGNTWPAWMDYYSDPLD
jgi:prepilin-type N-terminal cleavage/methylation domain-containing protein